MASKKGPQKGAGKPGAGWIAGSVRNAKTLENVTPKRQSQPSRNGWTGPWDRQKLGFDFGSAGGIITVPYDMQITCDSMRGLEKLPLQRRRELLRTLPTRGPIKATVCLHERCSERDEKEEKEVVRSIKLYAKESEEVAV